MLTPRQRGGDFVQAGAARATLYTKCAEQTSGRSPYDTIDRKLSLQYSSTIKDILDEKGYHILSIGLSGTVYEALELMAARGVGALMVIENGELKGIFSERDYARKVILQGKASRDTPVSAIMSTTLTTVTLDADVSQCLSTMTQERIRHLPVLDNGRVIGIVSIGDLVKQELTDQKKLIELLQNYIYSGGYA